MLCEALLEFAGDSLPGVGHRIAKPMADKRHHRGAGIDESPAADPVGV
jgi:hypothetical protein